METLDNSTVQTDGDKPIKGRRAFVRNSISLLGIAVFSPFVGRAQTPTAAAGEQSLVQLVTLADSLDVYSRLLDDVKRLVLRDDVETILDRKLNSETRLMKVVKDGKELSLKYPKSSFPLPVDGQDAVHGFLTLTLRELELVSRNLTLVREGPVDELRRIDDSFDKLALQLSQASDEVKWVIRNSPTPEQKLERLLSARKLIEAVISELTSKYTSFAIEELSNSLALNQQIHLITPKRLCSLLQVVRDLLEQSQFTAEAPARRDGLFRPARYRVETGLALQKGIIGTLNRYLEPASFVQVTIGYTVTFPIIMRVSNKEDRRKLLRDALRLVPPGLRDPKLRELANALADV